jgi:hypothetical protein
LHFAGAFAGAGGIDASAAGSSVGGALVFLGFLVVAGFLVFVSIAGVALGVTGGVVELDAGLLGVVGVPVPVPPLSGTQFSVKREFTHNG